MWSVCKCFLVWGVSHSPVNISNDTSFNRGGKGKYPGALAIHLNVNLLKCPRLHLPNQSVACMLIVHYERVFRYLNYICIIFIFTHNFLRCTFSVFCTVRVSLLFFLQELFPSLLVISSSPRSSTMPFKQYSSDMGCIWRTALTGLVSCFNLALLSWWYWDWHSANDNFI